MPTAARSADAFNAQLRRWRGLRRLSQLELALEAGVSARHVSFLETGRANPSRDMVIALADALRAPPEAVNGLLLAAGFAPAYAARPLDDASLSAARRLVETVLARHAPDPAIAMDRHWRLVLLNPPARAVFAAIGLNAGDSLLDAFLDDTPLRAAIQNWSEVAPHLHARLRAEIAHFGTDPTLEAAAQRLQTAARASDGAAAGSAIIPVRLAVGGASLSLVSAIATIGATTDIALHDLQLELFAPADEESAQILRTLTAAAT